MIQEWTGAQIKTLCETTKPLVGRPPGQALKVNINGVDGPARILSQFHAPGSIDKLVEG